MLYVLMAIALLVGCGDDDDGSVLSTEPSSQLAHRDLMRHFVHQISASARRTNPNFIIIPQNGHELLTEEGEEDGPIADGYLESIDGVGREDLYYGYDDDDTATPVSEQESMTAFMDIAERHGVEVLVTDYCWTGAFVDDSYSRSAAKSYVSFAADHRELDNIPAYPERPINVNTDDVTTLAEAKNFLYLLNPGSYANKEQFSAAIQDTDFDVIITDLFYEGVESMTSPFTMSL